MTLDSQREDTFQPPVKLFSEYTPDCINGRMRDGCAHLDVWGVDLQEEPSDDHSTVLENEDSSAESESNEADQSNFLEVSRPSGILSVVSVTVGLPTRFGNPNEEGSEAATSPFPECSINSNLRDILKKVTVNESALRAAIERLGRGTKGLKAVRDYVKFFLESRDPGDVNPEAFSRGLEQFCLHHGEAKEDSHNKSPPEESERQDARSDVHVRGQEDWARNVHGGEPYSLGYDMSGYFPNFCYPYPPPFARYAPYTMGVQPMYMSMMGVPYFSPPVQENVHANDAMTRAYRKSRIERRRVHGSDHLQPRSTVKPAHVTAVRSGRLENTTNQSLAVAPAGQGLNTSDLVFLLAKQLSPSGVSSLGRIVLPKKEAEAHLPHLLASEGVLLTMTDFDNRQSWTFRYRFWSNNKSRMYLLENTRDFVKAHNLQERDMLVLYRDAGGSYVVRGEKNGANRTRNAAGDVAAEVALTDELSKKKQKI